MPDFSNCKSKIDNRGIDIQKWRYDYGKGEPTLTSKLVWTNFKQLYSTTVAFFE